MRYKAQQSFNSVNGNSYRKDQVIGYDEYYTLSFTERSYFTSTYDSVTTASERGFIDDAVDLGIGLALGSMFDSDNSSSDSSSDSGSSFDGFDGGSFGGGGASSDF